MTDDASARRVGLLGGTFDPPHLGHLVIAAVAIDELELDEMRLLVAGDPWMKHGESPVEHRLAMAELAAEHEPLVVVDDREAHRSGPTYTVETLEELHDLEPDVEWTFVLGADAALGLEQWHRVDDLLTLARLAVVPRSGTEIPDGHPFQDHLVRLDMPMLGISSTDIRARMREGRTVRHLVLPSVQRYIEQHGLYRAGHG